MAKTKKQKEAIVEEYLSKISESKAVLIVHPKKVSANEAVELKKKLSGLDSSFNVIKNTLFKLALEKASLPTFEELEGGANAVVFSGEDVTSVAKLLSEFSKETKEERLAAGPGIMDGAVLSAEQVKELADMPPKEVIIAQIAGILQNPMVGVVNVMQDSVRSITYVLDQAFQE